jgi:hypothetical protein
MYRNGLPPEALTLIEPAEPPVGSVVVQGGIAWVRDHGNRWYGIGRGGPLAEWPDLSDGEVIFQPGAES